MCQRHVEIYNTAGVCCNLCICFIVQPACVSSCFSRCGKCSLLSLLCRKTFANYKRSNWAKFPNQFENCDWKLCIRIGCRKQRLEKTRKKPSTIAKWECVFLGLYGWDLISILFLFVWFVCCFAFLVVYNVYLKLRAWVLLVPFRKLYIEQHARVCVGHSMREKTKCASEYTWRVAVCASTQYAWI